MNLSSELQLRPAARRARMSGWQTECEFEGVTAPDGATRYGCEITFGDRERLEPGETAVADIRLWVPPDFQPDTWAGQLLTLYEGHSVIATGRVVTPIVR